MPKRLEWLSFDSSTDKVMDGSDVGFGNKRKGWFQWFWSGQLAIKMELQFKRDCGGEEIGGEGSIPVILTHSVEPSSASVT